MTALIMFMNINFMSLLPRNVALNAMFLKIKTKLRPLNTPTEKKSVFLIFKFCIYRHVFK